MLIDRMRAIVGGAHRVGIDTETTGLDWKEDILIGVAVANEEDRVYVPINHVSGNYKLEEVKEILDNANCEFYAHNAKFDLHFLMNCGIGLRNVRCTQIMAALLDENRFTYNLDDLSRHYLGRGKVVIDDVTRLRESDGADLLTQEYASCDADLALGLAEKFIPQIIGEQLERVWEMEVGLTYTLMNMERRGVMVDSDRLNQFKIDTEEALRVALLEIHNINPKSGKQVEEYLRGVGVEKFKYTKKGNVQLNREFLESIEQGQPILDARRYRTTLDSFCKPLREKHLYGNFVHTNFNQLKSEDGSRGTIVRLSSNSPNLQQVPKRDKMIARPFRRCFIAPKGWVWVKGDYNQQEYRMFASYANAKQLIDGYNAEPPVDMHQIVADLLGVERDPTAKRMNMGMLNGMGSRTLAGNLGVDEVTAKSYLAQYHQALPDVNAFNKMAENAAKSRGYVKTMLGRRMRFPQGWFAHKAPSRIIQGSSADLTKLKMVEVDKYFRENGNVCKLILSVHDELDWIAQDNPEGHKQSKEAIRIMESIDGLDILRVKMKVDDGIGPDWGIASFGEQQ